MGKTKQPKRSIKLKEGEMSKQEIIIWLSGYGRSVDRTKDLQEQLAEMSDEANKLTATYGSVGGGKSGGTSHDRIADIVAKQEEIRTMMYDELYQQNALQMEIKQAINKIDNPLYRSLLEQRYLHQKPWWKVAERLHYSEVHCRIKLFDSAISQLIKE